ncbi:MAG: hypothetical protein MRY74_08880 [Neomegalonema sp.]|nr:hypothetical protein [Neomegalonema sp.]
MKRTFANALITFGCWTGVSIARTQSNAGQSADIDGAIAVAAVCILLGAHLRRQAEAEVGAAQLEAGRARRHGGGEIYFAERQNAKSFVLYLRAPESSSEFKLVLPGAAGATGGCSAPRSDALECLLFAAMKLNLPNSVVGGEPSNDADWKGAVARAIKLADWILVVPTANDGGVWQLREILRQDALARTIFVMPSHDFAWASKSSAEPPRDGAYDEIWRHDMLELTAQLGLQFPHYDPWGAFFTFSARSSPPRVAQFPYQCTQELLAERLRLLIF